MKKRKRNDFIIHDKSLSHTNIDILLEHKLRLLENTRVILYQISDDATKAMLNVLNSTEGVRNLVILSALDIGKFMQPGFAVRIIANATKDINRWYGSTKNPIKKLSFIIPICHASGNWAIAYLSCHSIELLQYSLQYINSATTANPTASNDDYKAIYNTLSNLHVSGSDLSDVYKLKFLETSDLSCNQQKYSKGAPLWASGHILIDNIERLCTARDIVPAKFYTEEYKSELLADNNTMLQEALELYYKPSEEIQTEVQKQNAAVVAPQLIAETAFTTPIVKLKSEIEQLLIESNKFINDFLGSKCTPHLQRNAEKIKERSSLLFDSIRLTVARLNAVMGAEHLLFHSKWYDELYVNIKDILKLQRNWSVILAVRLQFFVKEIQDKRQNPRVGLTLKYFFEIFHSALRIIDKKDLVKYPKLENIGKKHKEYLDSETIILSYTLQDLIKETSIIKDFFVNAKVVFLAVSPILHLYKRHNNLAAEFSDSIISQQVGQYIKLCNDVCFIMESFDKESRALFNLKNPKIEQALLKEEQELAEKKRAEQDKMLQNAARDVVFKNAIRQKFQPSTKTASTANNGADQELSPEQKINNIINAYKNSIDCITQLGDLQKQVEKISAIEERVIAKGWILSVAQKLDLAECLVLSVFFSQNMINDIESLGQLQQKVLSLCLDDKQLTLDERLKSNIIVADLFNIYAKVLHKKCGNEKYKLVDYDDLNRPMIVITPELVEEKFMLFALYKKTMQQLNTYVKAANEVLAELIHPQNPDGLEWSFKQYTQCQDEYVLTLAHLEEEQGAAKEQRKYYKKNIKPKLICKNQFNKSPIPSNAAVVQFMLREFIFNSKKMNQMKQLGMQCAQSIECINRTFKAKIESKDTSLAYLNGMTYSYARSRSKSLNEYGLNNDVLDIAGAEVVRPRCESLY